MVMFMTPLKGKRILIFDWDGTLFDSMPIKRRTFSEVVAQYLQPQCASITVATVCSLYVDHGGKPRREIFQEVARHYGVSLSAV